MENDSLKSSLFSHFDSKNVGIYSIATLNHDKKILTGKRRRDIVEKGPKLFPVFMMSSGIANIV